jgi:hypothetical protein
MSLFFRRPASCTRSGWRESAVAVKRIARAKRRRTFATIRMRPPRAGPGAAGVSQAWGTIRSCPVNVITPRRPIAIAGAVTDPRGADDAALDSAVGVRRRLFAMPCKRDPFPNHGGLTPAALGCVFASPRTLPNSHRTAFAFPTHGGLTPAAPADVRLCIAKIAISPADIRTATQERGASAPRGFATATTPGFVIAPLTDSRDLAEAY